jgi:hypothetical protein
MTKEFSFFLSFFLSLIIVNFKSYNMKFSKYLSSFFIFCLVCAIVQSCSEKADLHGVDDLEVSDFGNSLNNTASAQELDFSIYCDSVSSSVYQDAKIIALFADDLTKDGLEVTASRIDGFLDTVSSFGSDTLFTVDEITSLYTMHLNMDSAIVYNYFEYVVNNRSSLTALTDPEINDLSYGIFCYISQVDSGETNIEENVAQSRWIIKSLLRTVGVELGCAGNVTVGVIETALLGAGTVITAPTGVGAVIGGAGTAASYLDTMNDAMDCL